ncbi:hypothetical protein Mlaev_00642 [Microbacterium laevaniformans]|uniref:Uncharacterized protein n=1 Tax=Microbacterium laevaniformans TaxID=36807 RepID=A0A150HGU4_9MICO|nr:hypothetical protein Mlaev_00642 [Microbacterium laevaniformans]
MLWELRDIALNPNRAMSEGERLRAIAMVLDRTMPKEVKHEVEVKPWEITMQQVFANAAPTLTRQPTPEQIAELEALTPEYDPEALAGYLDPDDIEDAEVVEDEDEDPRDALWQIHPARGANDRATATPPRVMVGSAEPPRRRRTEEDD